ncbi:uncharacterized protein [Primulina huaijiensis]|uniref:uncharacterized protein isoform X4 n=1 Tax=Primulina huaijiensis TaxID=1492673 RepID=UPI003CC7311D
MQALFITIHQISVMDPSLMFSDNPSLYCLAELISSPLGGGGVELGAFGGGGGVGDASLEESTVTELSGGKRIRGVGNSIDGLSSKLVLASNANHAVARREKISERMKILQDLVPGCNKFLSMKLEAVNSGLNHRAEGFPSEYLPVPISNPNRTLYVSKTSREYDVDTQMLSFGT